MGKTKRFEKNSFKDEDDKGYVEEPEEEEYSPWLETLYEPHDYDMDNGGDD